MGRLLILRTRSRRWQLQLWAWARRDSTCPFRHGWILGLIWTIPTLSPLFPFFNDYCPSELNNLFLIFGFGYFSFSPPFLFWKFYCLSWAHSFVFIFEYRYFYWLFQCNFFFFSGRVIRFSPLPKRGRIGSFHQSIRSFGFLPSKCKYLYIQILFTIVLGVEYLGSFLMFKYL